MKNILSLSIICLPLARCKHWYAFMYAQSRHSTSEASKSCRTQKTQQNDGTHCVWFRNPSKRQLNPFLVHHVYELIIRRQKRPLTTLRNKRNIWQSTVEGLIERNREKNRNHRWTYLIVYRRLPIGRRRKGLIYSETTFIELLLMQEFNLSKPWVKNQGIQPHA